MLDYRKVKLKYWEDRDQEGSKSEMQGHDGQPREINRDPLYAENWRQQMNSVENKEQWHKKPTCELMVKLVQLMQRPEKVNSVQKQGALEPSRNQ